MAVLHYTTVESRNDAIINFWNHGLSSRHIASLTGVSHGTVRFVLRMARGDGRAFTFKRVRVRLAVPAIDKITKEATKRGIRPSHLMMEILQGTADKRLYANVLPH